MFFLLFREEMRFDEGMGFYEDYLGFEFRFEVRVSV